MHEKISMFIASEMQTKTTLRYLGAFIRIAKMKNKDNPKYCRGCGDLDHYSSLAEYSMVQPLMKNSLTVS